VLLGCMLVSNVALAAGEYGTAAEAKAMLDRAVVEVKKDKNAALAKFNKGDKGFKDRDLYVFCGSADGTTTAHPTHLGKNMKELKDKKGKAFGEEMFKVAEEGKYKQVAYMWPKRAGPTRGEVQLRHQGRRPVWRGWATTVGTARPRSPRRRGPPRSSSACRWSMSLVQSRRNSPEGGATIRP
jgi:signal transduction histidine kinase